MGVGDGPPGQTTTAQGGTGFRSAHRPRFAARASFCKLMRRAARWSRSLPESGAGDQTMMDIAGHVSRQMLARYSRIRMDAKRKALESIVSKPEPAPQAPQPTEEQKTAPPTSAVQ